MLPLRTELAMTLTGKIPLGWRRGGRPGDWVGRTILILARFASIFPPRVYPLIPANPPTHKASAGWVSVRRSFSEGGSGNPEPTIRLDCDSRSPLPRGRAEDGF